ncbi:MAG: methyltransferase domain-containing protein [Alphaproteobacteria bacterium]|nr:methyltransferase domain-containing protein [Alphaproteobacteria bacterium]
MSDNFQETEGLLSPMIRDIRLKQIASQIAPNSLVLDLASGAGHLSTLLPKNCDYIGVDRKGTKLSNPQDQFVQADLTDASFVETVKEALPRTPDYITCAAFLEHITDPVGFIGDVLKLFDNSADFKMVGTTPHPRGRLVHDTLASIGLCSQEGADEHETFLNESMLKDVAQKNGLYLTKYKQFLFGMNQLFIYEGRKD